MCVLREDHNSLCSVFQDSQSYKREIITNVSLQSAWATKDFASEGEGFVNYYKGATKAQDINSALPLNMLSTQFMCVLCIHCSYELRTSATHTW